MKKSSCKFGILRFPRPVQKLPLSPGGRMGYTGGKGGEGYAGLSDGDLSGGVPAGQLHPGGGGAEHHPAGGDPAHPAPPDLLWRQAAGLPQQAPHPDAGGGAAPPGGPHHAPRRGEAEAGAGGSPPGKAGPPFRGHPDGGGVSAAAPAGGLSEGQPGRGAPHDGGQHPQSAAKAQRRGAGLRGGGGLLPKERVRLHRLVAGGVPVRLRGGQPPGRRPGPAAGRPVRGDPAAAQPRLRLPGHTGAGTGGAQPPGGGLRPGGGDQRSLRDQGAGKGGLRHHLPLPPGGGGGAGGGDAVPGGPHRLPRLPRVHLPLAEGQRL